MRSENIEIESKSLTDDLPVCHLTGAGFVLNQTYKRDGTRQEAHKIFDRSFHCQQAEDQTCLYVICSGQNGYTVSEFAIQKISAEILFGELNNCAPDKVKDVLRQVFISVEKDYVDTIGAVLAQKIELQCKIQNWNSECEFLSQLNEINNMLTVGSSAVLALIYNSKLYICNIGNCRAILCKTDEHNVLHATQLSVDHNIENEDEILRLTQLGIDVQSLKQSPFISTRCIGCYSGKSGYKDSSYLSGASSEPIISQPEIVGPISLDESCEFLVLMSGGLCRALQDIYPKEVVNRELIDIIYQQFKIQSTLPGVSQAAVDKVAQLHHDSYMHKTQVEESPFINREDITLLVRNFNVAMPKAIQRNNLNRIDDNSIWARTGNSSIHSTMSSNPEEMMDRNVKIRPYVDFTDFYNNVEAARENRTLSATIQFD